MSHPKPTGQSRPTVMSADRLSAAPAQVTAVPLGSLAPGYSPRLGGEHRAHTLRLAQVETPLPPILVDRRGMRVIDGMHRLIAASLRGQETIDVEFFDGSSEDAFLHAVKVNVKHGLPLSLADRRAAAARIITSHPEMSDRAIGEAAGLAAKTVAGIRRGAAGTQVSTRVGKDGRIRPLDSAQGRQRAAALLEKNPDASLREIARGAGISPATVQDVRNRIARGEEHGGGRNAAPVRHASDPRQSLAPSSAVSATLGNLLRDPSLRHNEHGRQLLRLLQINAVGFQEWPGIVAAIPSHRLASICWMARQNAQIWQGLAQELERRMQASDLLTAGK